MSLFVTPYKNMLAWFLHHKSTKYLYGLSFIEAIFFPIPPDLMLIPMCVARPDSALKLALMTTLFSVGGGIVGYAIGFFLFDQIQPWIATGGFLDTYQQAKDLMDKWGVWIILTAGFSPIPYKLFTIGAGVLEQNFILFFIASLAGRSMRFFLLAILMRKVGPAMLPKIEKRIEEIGWAMVIVLLMAITVYYLVDV